MWKTTLEKYYSTSNFNINWQQEQETFFTLPLHLTPEIVSLCNEPASAARRIA
jgi:hypothetical protein